MLLFVGVCGGGPLSPLVVGGGEPLLLFMGAGSGLLLPCVGPLSSFVGAGSWGGAGLCGVVLGHCPLCHHHHPSLLLLCRHLLVGHIRWNMAPGSHVKVRKGDMDGLTYCRWQ